MNVDKIGFAVSFAMEKVNINKVLSKRNTVFFNEFLLNEAAIKKYTCKNIRTFVVWN